MFKFFNCLEKHASTPHWSTFCYFFDEIGVLQSTRRVSEKARFWAPVLAQVFHTLQVATSGR